MALAEIPRELLWIILGSLPRTDIPSVYQVCKRMRQIVRDDRAYFMHIEAPITLYREQYTLYTQLVGDTRRLLTVQAPMGTGKTALMLMRAIDYVHRGLFVIIMAPVKTFDTWRNEIVKFQSDPRNKVVVRILHGTRSGDMRAFCKADPLTLEPCIFLTTPHYLSERATREKSPAVPGVFIPRRRGVFIPLPPVPVTAETPPADLGTGKGRSASKPCPPVGKYLRKLADERDFSLIVDEAYVCANHAHAFVIKHRLQQAIYTSANSLHHIRADGRYSVTIDEAETRSFAQLVCKPFPTAGLAGIIAAHTKVVIFTGDSADSMVNVLIRDPALAGTTFMKYEGSRPGRIAKFEKTPNCVLVCQYRAASEGINLNMVDAAIFHKFEQNGNTAAEQCMGRIRRRNNTHSVVSLYMWEGTHGCPIAALVAHLRSRLNLYIALQSSRVCSLAGKKTSERMRDIVQALRHNEGVDPADLTDWEIYFLFAYSHSEPALAAFALRPAVTLLPLERLFPYVMM